ncbi:MAG: phosphotransferase family protein, partial [Actinomycetota bacterium]
SSMVFRTPCPCSPSRCRRFSKRPGSDDTMLREARVLGAIAGSAVPHARLVAMCADVEVIGAAFYLMEAIDGFNPTVEMPELHRNSEAIRFAMGLEMACAAAALSEIDYLAVGLEDFGRPEGYLARQAPRWRKQLSEYSQVPGYDASETVGLLQIAQWLEDNVPSSQRTGLIHGDFHLANAMFEMDGPRLAAIVDWELSTIGDTRVDLGWLLATWPGPGTPVAASVGARPWQGFPTREQLIDSYCARSGRIVDDLQWFELLACFKLAVILEGTHARACAGKAKRSTGDRLHAAALGLAAKASGLIQAM